jgi:hypothetical protein
MARYTVCCQKWLGAKGIQGESGEYTWALPILAVVFECLVNDIPGVALTFVMASDVLDMCCDNALHLIFAE